MWKNIKRFEADTSRRSSLSHIDGTHARDRKARIARHIIRPLLESQSSIDGPSCCTKGGEEAGKRDSVVRSSSSSPSAPSPSPSRNHSPRSAVAAAASFHTAFTDNDPRPNSISRLSSHTNSFFLFAATRGQIRMHGMASLSGLLARRRRPEGGNAEQSQGQQRGSDFGWQ